MTDSQQDSTSELTAHLRVQRGRLRSSLTIIEKFIQTISQQTTVEEILTRIDKLNTISTSYCDVDDKLVLNGETSTYEEFDERSLVTMSRLKEELHKRQAERNKTSTPELDMQGGSGGSNLMQQYFAEQRSFFEGLSQTNRQETERTDIHLPKINLPTFGGDYRDWPAFKDLFLTTIHNKCSLSKVYKFHYLKSALKDEAASLIKHFNVTESNYDDAWSKLLNRYDKNKQILTAYIKTFLDLPAFTTLNFSNLRKTVDTADEIITAISSLGTDAATRDPWLIYLLINKCDIDTQRRWAEHSHAIDYPAFADLISFLNKRCDSIASVNINSKQLIKSDKLAVRIFHTNTIQCIICQGSHHLFKCQQFKDMDVQSRRSIVQQKQLCFNCLGSNHKLFQCKSKHKCHMCNKQHHSLLHIQMHSQRASQSQNNSINSQPQNSSNATPDQSASNATHNQQLNRTTGQSFTQSQTFTSTMTKPQCKSLLPTALVYAMDMWGNPVPCRILLDTGSEVSFVSENFAQQLRLHRQHALLSVKGLTPGISNAKGKINIALQSRHDASDGIIITAFILQKLMKIQSACTIGPSVWNLISGLPLANPQFFKEQVIDVLLGADYCLRVLKPEQFIGTYDQPSLQNTKFGYVVAGNVNTLKDEVTSYHTTIEDLNHTLRAFWEYEEVSNTTEKEFSKEEQFCEDYFQQNCKIDEDTQRYKLKLPFTEEPSVLGDTLTAAISRLNSVEIRFKKQPQLQKDYNAFMNEYLNLNHMEPIPSTEMHLNKPYAYLPHHAVVKSSSTTTKLRVVFDGSCSSSNNRSLNQILAVGPKIQRDLQHILLSFRTHKVAISADIEKMYRQILIEREDQNFQRIVWRSSSNQPIQHFRLKTVTYGTSCAPFLAIRALKQLANESNGKYPHAENAILNSFYVDDFLGGAETVNEAKIIHDELNKLLGMRGFPLRKWTSNSKELLQSITTTKSTVSQLINDQSDSVKVLGLLWIPGEDAFSFCVNFHNDIISKRQILSNTSRIFDPLGLLSPVTISLKIMLQNLWLKNISWDEEITDNDIRRNWNTFTNELCLLEKLRIPRWTPLHAQNIQLHGFADASEHAYAAVIYCRTIDSDGTVNIRLVTAKTRVAPIKRISIPRLELNAALLLSKLIVMVKTSLQLNDMEITAWTDSSITLAWLSSHPSKWKNYISNRTSEILSVLPREIWHHIYSKDNPADLASRGITISKIMQHDLWWKGPLWLQGDWKGYIHDHTINNISQLANKELRPKCVNVLTAIQQNDIFQQLFNDISSFHKILRIIARCRRVFNLRRDSNPEWITTPEIHHARVLCIRWCQHQVFQKEFEDLHNHKLINQSCKILTLSPFLDIDDIIRVGGRIQNSSCSYNTKHPIILPKDHILTKRIITYYHQKHLHAGTTLLISILRQEFWILSCRVAVKSVINNCVVCTKHRAAVSTQLMGNLPTPRVSFDRVFKNVGIDYAGPIWLLKHKGRGAKCMKGYICLFTCLAVRAIHLEVVSDLTTDAFLSSLKRFISRRGLPDNIYSDNGSNFIGANKQLQQSNKGQLAFHTTGITSFWR